MPAATAEELIAAEAVILLSDEAGVELPPSSVSSLAAVLERVTADVAGSTASWMLRSASELLAQSFFPAFRGAGFKGDRAAVLALCLRAVTGTGVLRADASPFKPGTEPEPEPEPAPARRRAGKKGRLAKRNVRCHLWSKAIFSGADELGNERSCHSATMHRTDMYVFGGFGNQHWYNTVSILDTTTMTWRKRRTKGETPCERYAHVAAQDQGRMYVFGGFGGKTASGGQYLNDIYVLEMETLEWSRVHPDGEPPRARAAAAAALEPVSRTWFIHGGNAGDLRLNDLHALDLKTNQWRRIGGLDGEGSEGPGPRAGHTLTLVGTELHLFGGGDTSVLDVPAMGDVFNDHYVLDLQNLDWARPELQWRCPPADGMPPAPRSGHGAAAVGSEIYIFGGHGRVGAASVDQGGNSGQRFLNDVHCINVGTNEWRQCTCGGAVPTPRAGFALIQREGTLYVTGGGDAKAVQNDLLLLDVSKLVDFPMDADDEPPSGSVLYVPGLEKKLKKRMKKDELVRKNILKQSVGSDAGSQEWWAARASVERKQLDQKLGRFLQNRSDAEHLRQLNILKKGQEVSPVLGGVVNDLEKSHRTRDLERLLQNRPSPDMVARQLSPQAHDNSEADSPDARSNLESWAEALTSAGGEGSRAMPSKQHSEQGDVESDDAGSEAGPKKQEVSPRSRVWPALPAPQPAPQRRTAPPDQPAANATAAAAAGASSGVYQSAGARRRAERVLAFQRRGEEKKRAAAAAAAAAERSKQECTLSLGQASDTSEEPLTLEPASEEDDNAAGPLGRGEGVGSAGRNAGTTPVVWRGSVQELCEEIAAELGSCRHLCKEEDKDAWLAAERRILRMLHDKLRDGGGAGA